MGHGQGGVAGVSRWNTRVMGQGGVGRRVWVAGVSKWIPMGMGQREGGGGWWIPGQWVKGREGVAEGKGWV